MRQLMWIAVLGAFTIPMAHAQSSSGAVGGTYNAGPPGQPPPGYQAAAPNPGNCGTPDDPKECGPMPKVPLNHYRAHRVKAPAKPPNG